MFQPRRSDLTAILVLPKIHNLTDAVLVRHLVFDVGELPQQNWNFHQTVEYLEFTHSDGVEMDFHFAIDVVTDLGENLAEGDLLLFLIL